MGITKITSGLSILKHGVISLTDATPHNCAIFCLYGGVSCIVCDDFILNQANEPRHEISNNVVFTINKGSDQPARTRSLIRAFASRLNII